MQSIYLHILCVSFTYIWIFFACLCIFLTDLSQLAGLQASPAPFQQALQQQLRQAHADSPGYGDRWAPPGQAPPPWAARRPAHPAAAAAPSVSAAAAFLVLLLQDKVAILAEYT